jgi:hypothetical protein
MGISANIIKLVKKQDTLYFLTDLNESMSLFQLLPKNQHYKIYQKSIEDFDFIQLAKNLNLNKVYITAVFDDSNGIRKVELNTGNILNYDDIPVNQKTCNAIDYMAYSYIGSKIHFMDTIYDHYNKKEHFKAIFSIDDIEPFYNFDNGPMSYDSYLRFKNNDNKDDFIVHLNY